jgi:hypothetical protein
MLQFPKACRLCGVCGLGYEIQKWGKPAVMTTGPKVIEKISSDKVIHYLSVYSANTISQIASLI